MADSFTHDDLLAQQKKEKKELLAKTQKMKHSVPKGNKRKRKEITSKIALMLADLDLKHEEQLKEFEDKNSATNPLLAVDMPKESFPILGASNLDSESGKNPEQNSPTGIPNNLSSTSLQAEDSTTNSSCGGGARRKKFPISKACNTEIGKDTEQHSPTNNSCDLPSTSSETNKQQAKNSATDPSWAGGARKKMLPIARARSPGSGEDSKKNYPPDNPFGFTFTLGKNPSINPSWEDDLRRKMIPISKAFEPKKTRKLNTPEDYLAAYFEDREAGLLYTRREPCPFERERSPESGKHSEQNSPIHNPDDLPAGQLQENALRTDEDLIDGIIPREIFPILRAPSPDSGKDSMPSSPPGTLVDDSPSPPSQAENPIGIIEHKNPIDEKDLTDQFSLSFPKPVKDSIDSESEKDTEQNASAGNPHKLPLTSSKKLSRAQKRRNKKSQKQKEREKAIADQDAINLLGCRENETTAILEKLSERKLSLFEIPSDGNCLYRAIEHQLGILNIQNVTAKDLRQLTATYLLSHRQDFTPFLVDPDTGSYMTFERYVKYCNDIVDANTWGGHIEVCALSKIFGKPIEIIQADRDITIGDESVNPKLIISYHRNLYRLGAHYNSVVPTNISM